MKDVWRLHAEWALRRAGALAPRNYESDRAVDDAGGGPGRGPFRSFVPPLRR